MKRYEYICVKACKFHAVQWSVNKKRKPEDYILIGVVNHNVSTFSSHLGYCKS
jgi:hypothetical protein